MRISVVIPTYNHKTLLLACLESLQRQTRPPDEVIVSIDGSTDGTAQTLAQWSAAGLPLRWFESPNGGRAIARNRGARRATGELIIFLDDDMRLMPEGIARHYEHHQRYGHSILVGATLEDPSRLQTDMHRYRAWLTERWIAPLKDYAHTPMPAGRIFLAAAHCSMPRHLFEQLGGFDERLRDAEDYDLGLRASHAGVPIYFNHELIAWNDDLVSCRSYINRVQQYQQAQKRLVYLKPELHAHNPYLYREAKGLRRAFYWFFSFDFWVRCIDKEMFWLVYMPRWLRYRLYSWVITAHAVHFPPCSNKKT